MKTFTLVFFLFISLSSSFANEKRRDYFELPPGDPEAKGLSESQYYKVLGTFMVEYYQLVKTKTGKDLIINFDWQNKFFGAFAKDEGTKYSISLWGGMSRAEGMTEELAYFILCHELGHILGGNPKQTIPGSDWASSEGQSDFFAAKRCIPYLLKKIPMKKRHASKRTDEICKGDTQCETIASIGKEFINFAQRWSFQNYTEVKLGEIPAEVPKSLLRNVYPSDQCRVETVIQGATCLVNANCSRPVCWYPVTETKTQDEIFF